MQVLEQPAISTLPDKHPPIHLIATEEERLAYLARPKFALTDLQVWIVEVEFLQTLARTMVAEGTPRENNRNQIGLMHRVMKAAAVKLHNAHSNFGTEGKRHRLADADAGEG